MTPQCHHRENDPDLREANTVKAHDRKPEPGEISKRRDWGCSSGTPAPAARDLYSSH